MEPCDGPSPNISVLRMLGFAFQLEESSNIAVISDKKLFVKAEFSPTAIEQFKRSVAMH